MVRPQPVNPAQLGPPVGYANGMKSAPWLFVAGQIGAKPDGAGGLQVVSDDFATQFEVALANVVAVVQEAGGDPGSILDMTVYVTDLEAYRRARKDIGQAWRRLLGRHYPAMTLVAVAGLYERGAKVEISARAVVP